MCFAHYNLWFDYGYGFPYPVIHSIDVKAQQVNRASRARLGYLIIDVLSCDPSLGKPRRIEESIFVLREKRFSSFHVLFVPVE